MRPLRPLRLLAPALLLVPLAAARLAAQEPAPPASATVDSAAADGAPAPPLSLDSLDASRLVDGRWSYVTTVTRRGASMELGRRTLELARIVEGGATAIVLVDVTTGPAGSIRDSVFLSAGAFRPLRQHAVAGPVTMLLEFGRDSITGSVTVPQAPPAPVSLPGTPAAVVGAGMLESLLALADIGAGWRRSVPQLIVSPVGAAVVPVTLEVAGREFATVPAGTFDCWVVDVSASGGLAQRLWVDVGSGRVVLVRNAAPGSGYDVLYETALVGEG